MYKWITLLMVLALSNTLKAQEEKFISLYLYNIINKYVEWPASAKNGDFVIDIVGHPSVFDKLQEVFSGKSIGSQPVKLIQHKTIAEISPNCQVLFIGFWQSKDIANAIKKINSFPTLVITEKPGMLDLGAAINMIIKPEKITFEINKSTINKNGLLVNSELYKIAESVHE